MAYSGVSAKYLRSAPVPDAATAILKIGVKVQATSAPMGLAVTGDGHTPHFESTA